MYHNLEYILGSSDQYVEYYASDLIADNPHCLLPSNKIAKFDYKIEKFTDSNGKVNTKKDA